MVGTVTVKFEFGKIGNDVIGRYVNTSPTLLLGQSRHGKIRIKAEALVGDYALWSVDKYWNARGRKFEYWDYRNRLERRVLKIVKAKGMK
jgi:hypothetical protein